MTGYVRMRTWIGMLLAALAIGSCQLPLVVDSPTPEAQTPGIPAASPTASPDAARTAEPIPTATDQPQPPAAPTQPQVTPTPTTEIYPFILQPGAPIALPNFARPELGCFWMGVAGQVFDEDGQVVKSVVVELGGSLAGIAMSDLKVAGGAKEYGPGGYEFTLAQRPLGTDNTLWVQLFDLAGNPVSERIFFSTYNDCQRNLILLNFLEVPIAIPVEPTDLPPVVDANQQHLPLVPKR